MKQEFKVSAKPKPFDQPSKKWNNFVKKSPKVLIEEIRNSYNKTKEYSILLEFLESKDIMKDYNEEKEDLINFMEEQLKRRLKPESEEFKKVKKLETQQKRLNTLIKQRKEAYNEFKLKLKGKTIDGETIENVNTISFGLTSKQDALVKLETLEQLNKELDEQLETTNKGLIMTK